MKLVKQIVFWVLVMMILTFLFGLEDKDFLKSFYFVTFLLPVAFGTSMFFNYFLVPHYLLNGRYLKFFIYFIYSLIISLYLEMLVIVAAFIALANYNYQNLNPQTTNIILLTATLYLVVLIHGFILLINRYKNKIHLLREYKYNLEKSNVDQLIIRSNRENIPVKLDDVMYLESMSDYVKVHLDGKIIITKEKISEFEKTLPSYFLRSHRSFIVNTKHINSFTTENIQVDNNWIPISRKYKENTISWLKKGDKTVRKIIKT